MTNFNYLYIMEKGYSLMAYVCFAISVVLYVIAYIIGIKNGVVPFVLLIMAVVASAMSIYGAVKEKRRSVYTYLYRAMMFFLAVSAASANRSWQFLDVVGASLAALCAAGVVFRIVFYLNKYGVRDIEQKLDE